MEFPQLAGCRTSPYQSQEKGSFQLTDIGPLKAFGLIELADEYIQDLEGSAVAYILRDAASQTVVPHITASNVEL